VWVASQVLCGRFGLHKYPYNTITRQALKSDHEDVTVDERDWKLGRGLTLGEIRQALRRTGSIPFICGPTDSSYHSSQARMRFLAYTFVESGLPVIAAYIGDRGGHAVTLVGHLLPGRTDGCDAAEPEADLIFGAHPDQKESPICKGRHLLLGQAVQLYYAHNDAYGPFDRLRLLSDKQAAEIQQHAAAGSAEAKKGSCYVATWRRNDATAERSERHSLLRGFVVPLPPYVQNNDPQRIVFDAIRKFDAQWPADEVQPLAERAKILWRCFLASAPDFKQSVVRRGYSPEICRRYVGMHLPLFVWVVEFTVLPPGSQVPYSAPRPIDGEFLYDSTTPFYEPQCISLRFCNQLRDFRTERDFSPCGKSTKVKCFIPVKTRR